MVTIKDVASAAGVSATTVSNVIHGYNSRVSKATAEKIQSVIEEMGYIPNMSARSLVSHSSHLIALVRYEPSVGTMEATIDPVFRRGLLQTENTMSSSGYYLMVRTCSTNRDLVTFLQNWNADGLFVSGQIDDEFEQALLQSGKPVMQVDTGHPAQSLPFTLQDDAQGGALAASYLLQKGHRKIGYAMIGTPEFAQTYDRLNGFRDTLREAGCPLDESLLFINNDDLFSSALALADAVSKAIKDGMTALAVSSDALSFSLMSILQKKGVRIPEDLSIIGYGDLSEGHLTSPELTTIHYSVGEKVSQAVSAMLKMLSGECGEPLQIRLPVSLEERSSVIALN